MTERTMTIYHPEGKRDDNLPGFVYTMNFKGRDLMVCGYSRDGKIDQRIVVHGYEKRRDQEMTGPYAHHTKETVILIESQQEKDEITKILKDKGYAQEIEFS